MQTELEREVLKGVSRSFYLSLRLLPAPMRRPAGIAYLLARTSDTIADSAQVLVSERVALLDRMASQVSGKIPIGPFPAKLIEATPDPREKILLEKFVQIHSAFVRLHSGVGGLIREVMATIISGQKIDLGRFENATRDYPVPLASDADLEDYTYRVAGCVGEFWTKLGFETLGNGFSKHDPGELVSLGVDFGKGLQLVNILRDLPEDLQMGRCYIPSANPNDLDELMRHFGKWQALASERMGSGIRYSSLLRSKRLRTAVRLPALIGGETLALMEDATFHQLRDRVKIPRQRVYSMLIRSLFTA